MTKTQVKNGNDRKQTGETQEGQLTKTQVKNRKDRKQTGETQEVKVKGQEVVIRD